jgi:sialidase-1
MFIRRFCILVFISLCASFCTAPDMDVKVTTRQPRIAILIGNEINPVLLIKIECDSGKFQSLQSVKVSFEGSDDLQDLDSASIYYMGQDSIFHSAEKCRLFGKTMAVKNTLVFTGEIDSLPSPCYFLLSVKPSLKADLHHRVEASCKWIISGGKSFSQICHDGTPLKQRIGVALRRHNDDKVHTFRIPGLTTTVEGSLLAIYDVRRFNSRDLQGDIDIGVSRSTDGGQSWEAMRIGLDMGKWGGLPEKFNGVSDASILSDTRTGKVFLAGLWMHGVIDENGIWQEGLEESDDVWNHQWLNRGSQPGFGVKETSQFLVCSSSDDGKTWSTPVNITKMCKKEDWWLWAPAPGHGITLEDGTLVFPTQGRDQNGISFSNITYSIDGGVTWKTSEAAYYNTCENMVVQLADGRIMLNARYTPNRHNLTSTNGRIVTTTSNVGKNWLEHPSSRSALNESACMAPFNH